MNEHEAYDLIMKQLCKEAIQIAEQIQEHKTISVQDLDKIDKIYHAKKSMLTVKAMEDADEYSQTEGMSGRRGRGSVRRADHRAHGDHARRHRLSEAARRFVRDADLGL